MMMERLCGLLASHTRGGNTYTASNAYARMMKNVNVPMMHATPVFAGCGSRYREFRAPLSSSSASSASRAEADPYTVLGVQRSSSSTELRNAYRKLALKHHPDRGGDAEAFKRVNRAYQILGDERSRREYDASSSYSSPFGQQTRSGSGRRSGATAAGGGGGFSHAAGRSGGMRWNRSDFMRSHAEAEEVFRAVFGPGTIEEILRRAYASQNMRNAGPFPWGEGRVRNERSTVYTRRRPSDGRTVLVRETTVEYGDGRVETTTTETEMPGATGFGFGGGSASYQQQRQQQQQQQQYGHYRQGNYQQGQQQGQQQQQQSGWSLMSPMLMTVAVQAAVRFFVAVLPRLIAYAIRFVLIGGRRR